MLLDSSSMVKDGLFEDDTPVEKPMTHEQIAIKQAAMGFTRTKRGIEVRTQPASNSMGAGEVFHGDVDSDPTNWSGISAGDIPALRRLGVGV